VGQQATEWLGQLTLAGRSAKPVDVHVDTIQPYPTFSEGLLYSVKVLQEELERSP